MHRPLARITLKIKILPLRPVKLIPELPRIIRVVRGIAPIRVQIPIRTATGPNHRLESLLDRIGITGLSSFLDIDRLEVAAEDGPEDRFDHVFDLHFVRVDH